MSLLAKLTFASAEMKKPLGAAPISTIEGKRQKLVAQLREQKNLIEAKIDGRNLILKKPDGSIKKPRFWWWGSEDGFEPRFFFIVRYGVSQLPLVGPDGAPTIKPITVPKLSDLPGVIDIIIDSVVQGEQDVQINKMSAQTGRARGNQQPPLSGIGPSWGEQPPEPEEAITEEPSVPVDDRSGDRRTPPAAGRKARAKAAA